MLEHYRSQLQLEIKLLLYLCIEQPFSLFLSNQIFLNPKTINNLKKNESPASELAHPFDVIKPEWEVSRKSVKLTKDFRVSGSSP